MINFRHFRPYLALAAIGLLLAMAGCQTNRKISPWAHSGTIPAGSYVELHESLNIATRDDQVFIQDGKTAGPGGYTYGYDQYYPFCYFQVANIDSEPQIIQPGRFEITRIYLDETEFVQRSPIKIASSAGVSLDHGNLRLLADGDAGGGVRLIVETTVMDLSSQQQPSVKRLVCGGGFDLEPHANLPTLDDIDTVLGSIATLVRNVDQAGSKNR